MQTLAQLSALERSLRDAWVLSVYVDGTATDPARQRLWRAQLDRAIADQRASIADTSHAEREEFEQCVRQLNLELAGFAYGLGAPGWVAFVSAGRTLHAEPLPAPMPTRAVWTTGASIAPYMRALKENRPVIVAIADSRRVNIYQYRQSELRRVTTVRAHHVVGEPAHMGAPPGRGFHSGTRGETGRDAAQRRLLEGKERMLSGAAERVVRLAGQDSWILVGGIPEAARALANRVSANAPGRVMHFEGLDVHASPAELARAARSAASALRDETDRDEIADISDHEAADGFATLGSAEVRQGLEESRVRALYLTHRYLEDHALEAEEAVRSAIGQGAAVEEVSGVAAQLLDTHGGIAARLRYRRR